MTVKYLVEEPYAKDAALLMKQAYAQIGVKVTVQEQLWNTIYTEAVAGTKHPQTSYDAIVVAWWPAFADGFDSLRTGLSVASKGSWNLSYWYHPEFDKLIYTAFADESTKPAEAQKLYDQAQQMIYQQCPMLYFWDDENVIIARTGLNISPWVFNQWYSDSAFWYYVTR